MDNNKQAADRVRHILQAMERSIDDARRKRVIGNDSPSTSDRSIGQARPNPVTPTPEAATPPRADEQLIGGTPPDPDAPVRLKARPKRPSILIDKNDDNWQSRAS